MIKTFNQIYKDVLAQGKIVSPRGQRTIEIEDYSYTLAPYDRFTSFKSRKLNLNYIKDELLWYLKGDRWDLSIADKAVIWNTAITDNQLNSNYGQYIFTAGLIDYVVECLIKDPHSRRAVMTILGDDHLYLTNSDVPCTVSMGFRIRDGQLNCSVHMRSQDAIYGMSNDAPFFSFVQEMVLRYLNDAPGERENLRMGTLSVSVESFHIYERHWEMAKQLTHEKQELVSCPQISGATEIDLLRAGSQARQYEFSNWLKDRS